jgi:hypothetical protein
MTFYAMVNVVYSRLDAGSGRQQIQLGRGGFSRRYILNMAPCKPGSRKGKALEKTAMRVVGQLGRGGLYKGGLAPAVALDYAEHTFLSAVSYGVLVWGYVGLLRNGIGKGWAGKVERQQVVLATGKGDSQPLHCGAHFPR